MYIYPFFPVNFSLKHNLRQKVTHFHEWIETNQFNTAFNTLNWVSDCWICLYLYLFFRTPFSFLCVFVCEKVKNKLLGPGLGVTWIDFVLDYDFSRLISIIVSLIVHEMTKSMCDVLNNVLRKVVLQTNLIHFPHNSTILCKIIYSSSSYR